MEFILIILGIALVYWVFVHIILPVASVAGIITLVISGGYALWVSLSSFIKSVKHNIDPYKSYVDKHADSVAGVKRNYCFGPGFHQISAIVKDAFDNLMDYSEKLKDWKDAAVSGSGIVDIWIYLGYGFAVFCAMVLGFVWVAAFSVVLATAIVIGMVVFFAFFSVLWLADRLTLLLKAITNRCANCKRICIVPVFVCPTCGLEHKKLVPGPYGVFKRKCSCGTSLSTTFLQGRSAYEAHCPFCGTTLLSSSSRQYGIQLVGGVGSGKTTYLAAFWHEYKDWISHRQDISIEQKPEEAFADLEDWFNTGKAESTLETNANMYSIIHTVPGQDTSVQMTIYDIAGEAFESTESGIQQQQFRYCEGFIIVIDPTADPEDVSKAVVNFMTGMREFMGKHSVKAASIPVAVIITKSDLYKKQIGLPSLKASYRNVSDPGSELPFEQHRNDTCRAFLIEHGYGNAVNLIEADFSNIQYFSVSAMGHSEEEGQYEPWGTLDPVFWLMSNENCPLRTLVQQP